MRTINDYNALAKQVTTHPCDLLKVEWRGANLAAASGLFLQIHDANVTPASGAVPAKSWPLFPASESYKEFKQGELNLAAGCFVGVSSTEATYTAATGNDKYGMLAVELNEPELPTGTSTAGDLTTGVTGRQIWAQSSGPKRLLRLEIDGSSLGGTRYAMLFNRDTVNNGDTPLEVWRVTTATPLVGANAITFGKGGRMFPPTNLGGDTASGCTVKMSTTPTTLTLISSGTAAIKGEYK